MSVKLFRRVSINDDRFPIIEIRMIIIGEVIARFVVSVFR